MDSVFLFGFPLYVVPYHAPPPHTLVPSPVVPQALFCIFSASRSAGFLGVAHPCPAPCLPLLPDGEECVIWWRRSCQPPSHLLARRLHEGVLNALYSISWSQSFGSHPNLPLPSPHLRKRCHHRPRCINLDLGIHPRLRTLPHPHGWCIPELLKSVPFSLFFSPEPRPGDNISCLDCGNHLLEALCLQVRHLCQTKFFGTVRGFLSFIYIF